MCLLVGPLTLSVPKGESLVSYLEEGECSWYAGSPAGEGQCGVSVSIGSTLRSESLVVQPPGSVSVFLPVWGE